ncbi:Ig-like domain-containing protein [Myxococcus stipitatus]|uniref:Ig-like domain-containing protein n=1 Tax=Myxococcus stipitatus TaxID=83455 RepID=UPI001F2120FE|nr:Ig-like domain-containing protein [Myxococcus stipitatus]MCE9672803.1 Ig-like domain-containing protein [Myxococcus stipitatus]
MTLQIVPLANLLVGWAAPTNSKTYTNGRVALEVRVENGQPERVELLADSTVIHEWTAPPYTYEWDTSGAGEGDHQITARATRGKTAFTSLPRTVIVDRTAPQVESRSPGAGATNVSVRAPIEVAFSEPVNPSSLEPQDIQVMTADGATLQVTHELATDGRTLRLVPKQPLPAPSVIRVTLGTVNDHFTDLAGNSLGAEGTWEFTVPAWLPLGGAISAYPGNTPAEQVVMKRGANGLPVIAWSEFDGTTKNIHAARWTGSTWEMLGGPLSALPGPETHATQPALYTDVTGTLLLAWSEDTGPEKKGRSAFVRKWGNNTWQSLPDFPGAGAFEYAMSSPSVTATPTGVITINLDIYDGVSFRIEAYRLAPNSAAWTAIPVNTPANQLNPNGSTITRFGDDTFTVYNAYFDILNQRALSVLVNHSQLLGASPINTPTGKGPGSAVIEADGNGAPCVAWIEAASGSTESDLYFTQWAGSSWSPPQRVSTQASANTDPSLAIGDDGHPIVAWSGFAAPKRTIFVARRVDLDWTGVGTPLSVTTGIDSPAKKPAIIIGTDNIPIIAWQELDGSSDAIHVRQLNQ